MGGDYINNLPDIKLFLYAHYEENLNHMKGTSWGEEIWGRGSNGNMYGEAGTSTDMLEMTTQLVSFLKPLMIRTNVKNRQLLLYYEYG